MSKLSDLSGKTGGARGTGCRGGLLPELRRLRLRAAAVLNRAATTTTSARTTYHTVVRLVNASGHKQRAPARRIFVNCRLSSRIFDSASSSSLASWSIRKSRMNLRSAVVYRVCIKHCVLRVATQCNAHEHAQIQAHTHQHILAQKLSVAHGQLLYFTHTSHNQHPRHTR